MLSRERFYFRIVSSFLAAFVVAWGIQWLVRPWAAIGVVHWLLKAVTWVLFALALFFATGGPVSYRHYVAAHGGELAAPNRFWAYKGPVIVCSVGVLVLTILSAVGSQAADGSSWRTAAGLSWIGVPGGTMFFCLIARDWRRELEAIEAGA